MNPYSYCIRSRYGKGWGRCIAPHPSHCHQCGAALLAQSVADTGATGYGCKDEELAPATSTPMRDATIKLRKGEVIMRSKAICYACCAVNDRASMTDTGRAVLYLCDSSASTGRTFTAQNWPGSLCFPVTRSRKSTAYCFGRSVTRYDVWFTGPDGAAWHGVNVGDNQILRCKRLKA